MIKQLARDAVQIKMSIKNESPLLSVYEYCYAVGFALSRMGADDALTAELRGFDDMEQWKARVNPLVKEAAAWERFSGGTRLRDLLLGCRISEKINAEALELFEMGLSGI